MNKRMREKMALLLLALLLCGGVAAMGWYIFVGHNWNMAALHIDDYVGEMEGYTVVTYNGVLARPEEIAQLIDVDAEIQSKKDSAGTSGVKVTASEIVKDYSGKNAALLQIDTSDISRYEDPCIYQVGNQRFGVFSITGNFQYMSVRTNVAYLKDHNVDKIVVVSDNRLLRNTQLSGVDLVIFACDAAVNANGEYDGGVFFADAPSPDDAKAVIIAPNNMMTAKTVTSL